ncbi:hypothetical protein F183_A55250 (plasmid) [Bryobacterales bacterium F-183]|nr:hypothetical protein F183_A55250 [Bryobacterales bacterium F-183]
MEIPWSYSAELVRLAKEITAALLQFPVAREAAAFVMAPGLLLFETLHIPTASDEMRLLAFFIGWQFWLRLLRMVYFALGRLLGFASITQYAGWIKFGVPWRTPMRWWLDLRRIIRHNWGAGSGPNQFWAGWWETAALAFNAKRGDIPIGRLALLHRFGLHMPIGLPDSEKSVACISYAGGGKSSWLATWLGCIPKEGAAVVFDMDGAFVNAFGDTLRAAGHRVTKIDPDSLNKSFPNGRWNPFTELNMAARRHGKAAVFAYAKTLAEALVVQDSKTQPVFADTARVMMTVLILYVWLFDKKKTLGRVRELLTRGMPEAVEGDESPFQAMLFELRDLPARYKAGEIDDGANGALCAAIANNAGLVVEAKQGTDTNAESPDNFRKTAIYQTLWIDDPNVAAVINGDSDTCGEIHKLTNSVTFIVSTLDDTQKRLAPLVRAFMMLTLYAFQRTEPDKKLKYPCIFLMDEFPNLGRMDSVAVAAPGYRKFGVRLVTVSQSIGLLKATYPEKYMEFLNQSGCVVWMGIAPTDRETLTYLSKDVLGECTLKEKIDGWHWFPRILLRMLGLRLPPARYQLRAQRLLTEGQCSSFLDRSTGQVIITREGRAPIRAQRLVYWKDLGVWQYNVHKGHGEKFWRARTREALAVAAKAPVPAAVAAAILILLAAGLSLR